MSVADLLSFAFVAAVLIISPGPNGMLIAKTVPAAGRAAGFANIAGFAAAFYLHGALAVFGISLILAQSAQAFFVVKMLGAAYLCWIGLKALWSAWRSGRTPVAAVPQLPRSRNLRAAVAEGFLTNALNPKVSMFYLAVFPQFVPHAPGGETVVGPALLLVTLHACLNLLWFGLMVMLFARLAGTVRNPKIQRWLKGVTGIVLLGFGIKLATLRAS
jgi:threonine/homoserine/homoserine lactone efflux protein